MIGAMRALAALATVVAGYLTYVSVALGGKALGCGDGAGCGEVLQSAWGKLLGLPVGAPATLAYAAMFAALCAARSRAPGTRRIAWAVLIPLAAAALAAAVWFVGLQAFVIKSWCPWCLADHALGATLSTLVLWRAFRGQDFDSDEIGDVADDDAADSPTTAFASPFPRAAAGCLVGLGLCATVMMIGAQVAFPSAGPAVRRLAESQNDDTGPGPDRRIAVLSGRLPLSPHELPVLGNPDAPKLLVVLFDYCCPHCRKLHEWLGEARARRPDDFAVILLPTPQNPRCNPAVTELEPRFEHACELARIALAVWRADRTRFAEFDTWLFAPEDPRTTDEARRHAESLVGRERLSAAESDPWIDQRIQADVDAYRAGGVERIPVILSPGFAAIVGRPADEETLRKILADDLDLRW